MRNSLNRVLLGLAVIGGLAVLWVIPSYAESPQVPGTMAQPGMSPARVWINNQKPDEAIPVHIVSTDPNALPVAVAVRGAVSVTGGPVTVTASRQVWEYRDVSVGANQGLAAGLNALGNDGWEAAGLMTQPNGSVTVLLKRPR